jgi:hypothetical protein
MTAGPALCSCHRNLTFRKCRLRAGYLPGSHLIINSDRRPAAGLIVVEVQAPRRADRRHRGKSDPIDAHLAGLQVLRMPAGELPAPRADSDREALRILLSARRELTMARTRQINPLRALLPGG